MFEKQGGQALPLGIALVLVGILSSLVLFNTGQTALEKSRLANAADAAAYSGLLWQARALNFQAYTNRAMVANQVSIAQAVSLQSWVSYGRITSENASTVLSGVPMISVLTQGMNQAFGAADSVIGPVAEATVPVVDWVNSVLAQSQKAMYLGSFVATPEIVEKIVADNDERFEVDSAYNIGGLLSNLKSWKAFTKDYDTSDRDVAQGRVDIIEQSTDRFTNKRDWKFFSRYFPITPITRVRVHRRGTTRLIEREGTEGSEWEWKAKDSMSLAIKIWRPLRSSKRVEIPIGWGEAFTNNRSSKSIEGCEGDQSRYEKRCAHWLRENRLAESFADKNVRGLGGTRSRTRIDASYKGIQDFRSLSDAVLEADHPVVELKVEVSMANDTLRTSSKLGASGRWDMPIETPGGSLSSVSAAELFYERPDAREIAFVEHANGYNPYWSVRLKAVSDADRLLALSLRSADDVVTVPASRQVTLNPFSESDAPAKRAPARPRSLHRFSEQIIAEIAEALNVDSDALMDSRSEFERATNKVLFSFIDEQIGDELSELEDVVANQLRDIIAEAVRQILRAALGKALGVKGLEQAGADLKDQVDSMLDGLTTNIDRIIEDVESIVAEAEEIITAFEKEMDRIQDEVAMLFAKALTEIQNAFDSERGELQIRYYELLAKQKEFQQRDENIPTNLLEEIKELAEQLEKLVVAELEHRLAIALVDIVDRTTDLFDLPYEAALEAVRAILLSESDDVNPLQITEVDDAEDDDW